MSILEGICMMELKGVDYRLFAYNAEINEAKKELELEVKWVEVTACTPNKPSWERKIEPRGSD